MRKILFLFTLLIMFIGATSLSAADSKYIMINKLWEKHEKAVKSSFKCWQHEDSIWACKSKLEDIFITEVDLLGYGISAKNKNLYANLVEDKENVNWSNLMYKIFIKKFEELSGWAPEVNGKVEIWRDIKLTDKVTDEEFVLRK